MFFKNAIRFKFVTFMACVTASSIVAAAVTSIEFSPEPVSVCQETACTPKEDGTIRDIMEVGRTSGELSRPRLGAEIMSIRVVTRLAPMAMVAIAIVMSATSAHSTRPEPTPAQEVRPSSIPIPPGFTEPVLNALAHRSPEVRDEVFAGRWRRLTEHRGTKIKTQEHVDKAGQKLQEAIIERFADQGPQPPQRLRYFQWCDQPPLTCTGWYGIIQDLAAVSDGYVVKVAVSPRLESLNGGIPFTSDRFFEYYHYSNDGLRFLRAEAPSVNRRGSGPNSVVID